MAEGAKKTARAPVKVDAVPSYLLDHDRYSVTSAEYSDRLAQMWDVWGQIHDIKAHANVETVPRAWHMGDMVVTLLGDDNVTRKTVREVVADMRVGEGTERMARIQEQAVEFILRSARLRKAYAREYLEQLLNRYPLSMSHMVYLSGVTNKAVRERLEAKVVDKGLTVEDLSAEIREVAASSGESDVLSPGSTTRQKQQTSREKTRKTDAISVANQTIAAVSKSMDKFTDLYAALAAVPDMLAEDRVEAIPLFDELDALLCEYTQQIEGVRQELGKQRKLCVETKKARKSAATPK